MRILYRISFQRCNPWIPHMFPFCFQFTVQITFSHQHEHPVFNPGCNGDGGVECPRHYGPKSEYDYKFYFPSLRRLNCKMITILEFPRGAVILSQSCKRWCICVTWESFNLRYNKLLYIYYDWGGKFSIKEKASKGKFANRIRSFIIGSKRLIQNLITIHGYCATKMHQLTRHCSLLIFWPITTM